VLVQTPFYLSYVGWKYKFFINFMSKIGIKHPIFDDIALYFICEATLFKQNNQNRVFYTYPEMSRILIYQ